MHIINFLRKKEALLVGKKLRCLLRYAKMH